MAGAKEIRTKIKSVQNTQKITSAMEMVAASKMRKAQDRMSATRPYADKMQAVVAHLAQSHPEYKHPYTQEREVKKVGYIVVSSDRGLCGGLNNNLFRSLVKDMKAHNDAGREVSIVTVGKKALGFFGRMGGKVIGEATQLGDAPRMEDLIGAVQSMLKAYDDGEIDQLFVCYNTFVNTMTQEQTVKQLLPVSGEADESMKHHWDYLYEPGAKEVLNDLMVRYIESLVYQSVVENIACEMAARMVAMKAATDNAGDLINELQLVYNKARQAAITQEISEIVGGAAAVS